MVTKNLRIIVAKRLCSRYKDTLKFTIQPVQRQRVFFRVESLSTISLVTKRKIRVIMPEEISNTEPSAQHRGIMIKKLKLLLWICIVLSLLLFGKAEASASSPSAGRVETKSTALNVRKTKDGSSAVIGKLKKSSHVTLVSKSGNRWKVEYKDGKYGYCHEDYIKKVSEKVRYVSISSGHLNVRSKKSTASAIKDKLKRGDEVIVLSASGGFSKILYNGTKTGFVKSSYLSASKPKTKSISLSVPSYKQNDSRWRSIKIGIQGDTIGSSGCTTTCLAMTESVRTKKNVTPKDMAERLTYTESGRLYWPENYVVEYTTNSTYLSSVYSVLKKGRPVIVGSKKANGSQHWVVVTGFSGNPDSPRASDFTINDPGSSSRTRLSEFISVYPGLYKLAYYK